MRIRCPFCDERDSSEFIVVGDAGCPRPNPELADADKRFLDAVYLRVNPAGRHVELWYHGSGCRSWLQVTRDTLSHQVFAVEFVQERAGQ
jgi:methylglutamate dehydrogenase subunit B